MSGIRLATVEYLRSSATRYEGHPYTSWTTSLVATPMAVSKQNSGWSCRVARWCGKPSVADATPMGNSSLR